MKKLAFTLAEIMIVLMVIGILTAILLPSARQAMPNEDVMKFKKAHNALYSAIQEMVNSDKYFLDGDLRVLPNGGCASLVDYYHINVLADIINGKVIAPSADMSMASSATCTVDTAFTPVDEAAFSALKNGLDNPDDENYSPRNIISDTYMRQSGAIALDDKIQILFVPPMGNDLGYASIFFNFDFAKRPNGVVDNVVNALDGTIFLQATQGLIDHPPVETFSYAIRYDGKIITSSKVDQWLEKSIQDKD